MKKTVLITGATSGIGEATAIKLAQQSYRLIITGRRNERLQKLAKQLSAHTEIHCLCFDIRNRAETFEAIQSLPTDWQSIDILINNAGLAVGLGPIQDGDVDDWEQMIDTNIKGLLYVSKATMPTIIANKGHIINICSIAGKDVYDQGNVYCASKFAVDALSRSMRLDLLSSGVKVSNVCPGRLESEFSLVRFKGNQAMSDQLYSEYQSLQSSDIADAIAFILSTPAHVCINDITITATAQASVHKSVAQTSK